MPLPRNISIIAANQHCKKNNYRKVHILEHNHDACRTTVLSKKTRLDTLGVLFLGESIGQNVCKHIPFIRSVWGLFERELGMEGRPTCTTRRGQHLALELPRYDHRFRWYRPALKRAFARRALAIGVLKAFRRF